MIVNWLPTALLSRKTRTLRSKVARLPARKGMRVERVEERLVLSPQIILSPAPVSGFSTPEAVPLAFNNVPAGAVPADPGIQITNTDPLAAGDKQTITIDTTGGTLAGGGFTIVGTNKYEVQLANVTIAAANAALKALVFTPDTSATPGGADFLGVATVSIKDHDAGNGSTIKASDATANFSLTVNPTYGIGNNIPTLKVGGLQNSPLITGAPLATLTLDANHGAAITLIDPNVPQTDVFQLTAFVPNDVANNPIATLNLPGLTASTSSIPGGTTFNWTGTLTQIQTALAGATLTLNAGATPAVSPFTITLIATDTTHNAIINSTIAAMNVAVQNVNALAPTLTVGTNTGYNPVAPPGNSTGAVAPNLTIAGPSISKVVLDETVIPGNPVTNDTLLIPAGLLTAGKVTGTNITVTSVAGSGVITLTGVDTAANYQKAIDAVQFLDTALNDTAIREVQITAFNGGAASLPVIAVIPPVSITSSLSIATTTVNVNQNSSNNPISGVSISDPNYNGPIQVVLTPTAGTFNVNLGSGVTVVPNAPGSPPGTLTFFGSLAQVNAALSGLTYTPAAGATGSASINLVVTELTGPGAQVSNITINVLPFNAAPVIHFAGPISTNANTSTGLGISVTDPDSATETVVVSVGTGSLSGTAVGGATLTSLTPQAVKVSGSIADVNATLATLSYAPALNFVGSDTVTVNATDGANFSFNSSAISVNAVGVAPTINGPTSIPTANAGGAAVAIGGLSVINNDTPTGTGTLTVTVTSAAGVSLNAVGATGNGTNALTISGSDAAVTAALSTLTFKAGNSLATGPVGVTVTATESVAHKSATTNFNVQVQAGPQVSGGNLGTTVSVKVGKTADIFGSVTIADSVANFNGGTLTVNLTGTSKGDKLAIHPGGGVQINGHKVKVGGVVIGTFVSTANSVKVSLNANATTANLETLLGALTFHSTKVGSGDRTASLSLTDGTSPIAATGSVGIHVHK
jgi:hypothetical protein